jgi:hypothetical protein
MAVIHSWPSVTIRFQEFHKPRSPLQTYSIFSNKKKNNKKAFADKQKNILLLKKGDLFYCEGGFPITGKPLYILDFAFFYIRSLARPTLIELILMKS